VPPASSTDAIDAANPTQVVATGQVSWRMVSSTARPLVSSPPGELMRSSTGSSGSSPSRNNSRAITSLARSASTVPDSSTTRRRSSRSTGSMGRSSQSSWVPRFALIDHAPLWLCAAAGRSP
jgi:hypothetical protein